jgi:hypothetical protein
MKKSYIKTLKRTKFHLFPHYADDKKGTRFLHLLSLITFYFVIANSQLASAQFTAGRIVAVQTTGSVSKGGSSVTLKEFTTDGTAGVSVAIPSTGTNPLQMAAGSGGSEGFLSRSPDASYLVLAGYSTSTTGITDITSTTSINAPRVIFKVDYQGNYTQTGSSTAFYSGNDIRGAISDGTNYWASGASGSTDGIDYFGPDAQAALAIGAKAYGLQIFSNQIYFSTQKVVTGITPSFGIYSLGTGLPTSGTVNPALVINTGTATPEDFSFNSSLDVCYIAINLNSSVGGIQKWIKSSDVWSLSYTLGTGATNIGAYALVVDYSGTNPVIYATTNEANTNGNRIIKITDTGASSTATTLVAAVSNTWFHGINFSPTCSTPTQPGNFTTSSSTVDLGQTAVTYTVPNDVLATSYNWSYSGAGATINGSGNTVTVDFSSTATSGTLSVTASNACGTSVSQTTSITVNGAMRITEFMYNGGGSSGAGEFVEFTNVGGTSVDMTGWSFDDNSRTAGSQDLSAFGTVQPGESVILTDISAATFRTNWYLCSNIKVIGGSSNNLGRADEINLYDASNTLVDRLTYDDQTLGGPRTTTKSAWVSATGLGANNIALWTLSAADDAEGSYTSTLSEIASPGASSHKTVAFNPCYVANSAPVILLNDTTTSNYLDGGTTTSPSSPYTISGVIDDPTDPAATLGIDFTINDSETAVDHLTVTVKSGNASVVPIANLTLTGTGSARNLKIKPLAVGYSNITITVNDGTDSTSYIIYYAASAASATPASTVWHTGMSDASDAISIDDDYFVSGDDELNVLNVYSRIASGLPLVSFDYTSYLSLPDPAKPEVDLEAATRSTANANRIYWLGSMSNSKSPFNNMPNRDRIFATSISGTGASTNFSFVGYYGNLRSQIIAWGDANGYDFTSSAAAGVDSKLTNGFSAEGMVFGPDHSTLYIGMRAPLVPTATRKNAVIVPIVNFETWFNDGAPSGNPSFGSPIELDLGGRGFRDLIRLTNGTYVILAGNPAGSPITSAIYKWSGNASDAPVLVKSSADSVLNIEGVMELNVQGNLSLSSLQLISDGGDEILYNDGNEAKDFAELSLRKFRSDVVSGLELCMPSEGDTVATACTSFSWKGSVYTTSGTYTSTMLNADGCDSVISLHLTINSPVTSDTSAVACSSFNWYGNVYSTSGIYSRTLSTVAGCDSIVTLNLTINPIPVVFAGENQVLDANVTQISLSGSVSNSTSQRWSTSGSGSFSPSDSTLDASYLPSPSDLSSGKLVLTLTSKNAGICNTPVSSSLTITFNVANGVADLLSSSDIQLIPNPNIGTVQVLIPEKYQATSLSICTLMGEMVKNINIETGITQLNLDLQDLKQGIYIVIVKDRYGKKTIKRMIKI